MSAVEAQRPSTPTTDGRMDGFPRNLASAQPQFFYPPVSQARGGSIYGHPFDGYSPYYYPAHDSYRPYDARAYGMPYLDRKNPEDEKPMRSPKEENSEAEEGHKKSDTSPPQASQPSSPNHEGSQRQSPEARRSPSPERTSPRREESSVEFSTPEDRRTPERRTPEERREFKQEQPYDFSRSRDEKSAHSPPIAERFRSASFSYTPQRYHLQSERSSDNSMSPPRYLPHYKDDDKWNQQSHPDPLTSLLQKYSGHPDMASHPSLQFPGMSKPKDMQRMPGHLPMTPPKYPVSLNNISPGHTSMSPRQPDSYPSPATPTRSRSLDLENMVPNKGDYYYCHLCSYVGNSKFHFNAHMNSHFEHGCPHCDYTSRTEGRLKRHIKDFHSEEPPDSFAGNKTPTSNKQEPEGPPNRPKIFKCRQCEFASENKIEFWEHSRIHIKEDKVLQCPKCPFVTEYKHHLEYHLRNHFGSKPFKCGKCNYACVNKSMLNSHMKSHTNVYQYRCSDCTYATKYCHSLKLHLKKYNHKPATVLNPDGSLPTDGSGDFELVSKRGPPRGPRGTKREKSPSTTFPSPSIMMPSQANIAAAAVAAAAAAAAAGAVPAPMTVSPALMPPHQSCWPPGMMTSSPNSIQGPPPLIPASSIPTALNPLSIQVRMQEAREPQNLCTKPAQSEEGSQASPSEKDADAEQLNCKVCEFKAESQQTLLQHVLRVHAAENQDLFRVFGMRAESMLTEEVGSDAIKEALRKSIEREEIEQSPVNKKHFNKVLAEDMLANIAAESTKKEPESNQEEEGEEEDEETMTPKRRMSSEDAEESTSPGDGPSPRKRSRKGKAYKLDMISIRLQERYTGSPPPEGSAGQEEGEASDSDDNKTKANEGENEAEKEKKAESQDENVYKVNGVNSEKVMHVIRCLEAEYGNEKPKWNGMNSPRPLEEIKNLNAPNINGGDEYECTHCNIAFGDCIMYTMHMGYHGFSDPFKCNMCGHVARDKVAFFLHIARAPHE
ncbi:hypothetical protein CAPTEDRAFT_199858 [Capitella teleta]|uniref:C2H2-type domain-containing protein n=2 Tax=Capitella TaxID=51293 RepID=R7VIE4_CAPTE|nr:hypothetical protein CAPTEDRAFT_199858 [Capitella teleta]|eukprot:ELU16066.1 hypothetical protein CAPTEDRAFT_199858 [Capitella teleta]